MKKKKDKWIIATRGSALALAQTRIIADLLKQKGIETETDIVSTKGDRDHASPLHKIGGDGLFVREIERELLSGAADIAVHSGKDLPYQLAEGTMIGCVPKAADPGDCLIIRKESLPDIRRIGTGSPRRKEQIIQIYPRAKALEIRGNVDTRLRKLREGQYDAILLAKAGLDRLGLDPEGPEMQDLEVRVLPTEMFLPAPCQGLIAVQCRDDDPEIAGILREISDEPSFQRFMAERYLFCALGADCADPVGAHAAVNGAQIRISAMLGFRRTERTGLYSSYRQLCDEIKEELTAAGSVTLVGAGCGSGLITVRGLEAVRGAEVLMYDDLMDQNLLLEAAPGCELIFCGKRMGQHYKPQEETTALIIRKAREGKKVVRLKGGDSFVFGRGGEEILALKEAGIPYEVIPGVTSGTAVCGHAGIPVTHRSVAQSVTFITGHSATDQEENYAALAGMKGTLVFFMGLSRIGEIASQLIQNGKSPETPAAVISRGYSAKERRMDGRLADIAEKAAGMETPALFVVGETAGFHMERTITRPLDGISVAVTGTTAFVHKTGRMLEACGAEVDYRPCLRIVPETAFIPADFEGYRWAVLTSENGVEQFFRAMKAAGTDYRKLFGLKFACLGTGTKEKLAEQGIYADLIPPVYTARELGQVLVKELQEEPGGKESARVLILRAENGSPDLTEELDRAGIGYSDIVVYHTEPVTDYLGERPIDTDYIVFGSAFGTRTFFSAADFGPDTVPVCIGPSTKREFDKHKDMAVLMPSEHTVQGITGEILKHRSGEMEKKQ